MSECKQQVAARESQDSSHSCGNVGKGKSSTGCPSKGSPSLTCAVPFFRVKSKATVTPALKAADGVSALAMGAEAGDHLALIDIFKKKKMCRKFLSIL